jgi:hypothetical protein
MMKNWLKLTLKITGITIVGLLALLLYTFLPMKLDVAANQTLAPASAPDRPDPARLPEVRLSILKTGKMPAKQVFAYRGGSWSGPCENGMAAILVRHPQASFLIDAGFVRTSISTGKRYRGSCVSFQATSKRRRPPPSFNKMALLSIR